MKKYIDKDYLVEFGIKSIEKIDNVDYFIARASWRINTLTQGKVEQGLNDGTYILNPTLQVVNSQFNNDELLAKEIQKIDAVKENTAILTKFAIDSGYDFITGTFSTSIGQINYNEAIDYQQSLMNVEKQVKENLALFDFGTEIIRTHKIENVYYSSPKLFDFESTRTLTELGLYSRLLSGWIKGENGIEIAPVKINEPDQGIYIRAKNGVVKGDTGPRGPEGPEGPQGPEGPRGAHGALPLDGVKNNQLSANVQSIHAKHTEYDNLHSGHTRRLDTNKGKIDTLTGKFGANGKLKNENINDNAIDSNKLDDNAVVNSKISDNSIQTSHIINKMITKEKIADGVIPVGGEFNKADYFTQNAEKLTKNDPKLSPGEAWIGYRYKGIQKYGFGAYGLQSYGEAANQAQYYGHSAGNQYYGSLARGTIKIGSTYHVKGDGKSKLIHGKESVGFDEIIEEINHLKGHKTKQLELLVLGVFNQANNTWTNLDNSAEYIQSVTNQRQGGTNSIDIEFKNNIAPGKYKLELRLKTNNTDNMTFSFPDLKTTWNYEKKYSTNNPIEVLGQNDQAGYVVKDIDMKEEFRIKFDLYYNGSEIDIDFNGKRFANHNATLLNRKGYYFKGTAYGTKSQINANANDKILGSELSIVLGNPSNRAVGLESGAFIYLWREVSE